MRIVYQWVRGKLTCGPLNIILDPEVGATGYSSSECQSHADSQKVRGDFDDGANALWSLYGMVSKTHDEARFSSWAEDMDSVGVFVCV